MEMQLLGLLQDVTNHHHDAELRVSFKVRERDINWQVRLRTRALTITSPGRTLEDALFFALVEACSRLSEPATTLAAAKTLIDARMTLIRV